MGNTVRENSVTDRVVLAIGRYPHLFSWGYGAVGVDYLPATNISGRALTSLLASHLMTCPATCDLVESLFIERLKS